MFLQTPAWVPASDRRDHAGNGPGSDAEDIGEHAAHTRVDAGSFAGGGSLKVPGKVGDCIPAVACRVAPLITQASTSGEVRLRVDRLRGETDPIILDWVYVVALERVE